ncbi:MAG: cadmium-translocating P-type ATPase [Magnetococcales bacterium]|nr:cadmium-translocating P-type ATPase [Magnetococcales bacterium]
MIHHNPSSLSCYHCALPIADEIDIRYGDATGQEHHFCCQGCLAAYHMIHGAGLEEYYRRRDPAITGMRPTTTDPNHWAAFDDAEFQRRLVRPVGDGVEICLLLEGMHCAACVWLNERVLQGLPGIRSARVNFATHRATVRWDPQQLSLSHILASIDGIGYHAEPYDPDRIEQIHQQRDRALLLRLGVAGFGAANAMFIAVALYAGYFSGIDHELKQFFHWVSLAIALPVVLFSGMVFFRSAWSSLRLKRLTVDVPVATGIVVTFGYSVWVTWRGHGEVFFDSVTMFIFILLTGRYLESAARRKAASATERLLSLEPRTARVLRDATELEIPVRELQRGDQVIVRPGERIAADGLIRQGRTSIDESMLTGESLPVVRSIGDRVAAGTLNQEGAILFEVTHAGDETALAAIVRLVEEAQTRRSPMQSLADRIAARFVVVILALALLTALGWWWVDPAQAIEHAVALLIITCPCALGLATPAAMIVASGSAAHRGVLIRGSEVLERLARVNRLVLDKTGTLTCGTPHVEQLQPLSGITAQQLLALVAGVEQFSEHPLARALVREAKLRDIAPVTGITEVISHPGAGVTAQHAGQTVWVGRPDFVSATEDELPPQAPWSWIGCRVATELWGWIALSDAPKADAAATIAALQQRGLRVTLLSGDHQAVVDAVAQQVGITEALGARLPQQKEYHVAQWHDQGDWVAMVGDGINDAPALARAAVAIVVENAADVSVATADVVLLNRRLESLVYTVDLARGTMRCIRQNYTISLIYNSLAIPLAMAGLVIPVVAAIAMPISSLIVIGNAMRLRRLGS